MIVFDLQCGDRHVFEAWFGSSADFESQRARGLMSCPICGDANIIKAVMAPAVPAKGNRRNHSRPMPADGKSDQAADSHAHPAADPAAVKAALAMLAKFQSEVEANAEYVGENLPDAARAIHLGEAPLRMIYGEASSAEAEALRDEGINLQRLPFRPRPRSDA